jgi:hypothetical protein
MGSPAKIDENPPRNSPLMSTTIGSNERGCESLLCWPEHRCIRYPPAVLQTTESNPYLNAGPQAFLQLPQLAFSQFVFADAAVTRCRSGGL